MTDAGNNLIYLKCPICSTWQFSHEITSVPTMSGWLRKPFFHRKKCFSSDVIHFNLDERNDASLKIWLHWSHFAQVAFPHRSTPKRLPVTNSDVVDFLGCEPGPRHVCAGLRNRMNQVARKKRRLEKFLRKMSSLDKVKNICC